MLYIYIQEAGCATCYTLWVTLFDPPPTAGGASCGGAPHHHQQHPLPAPPSGRQDAVRHHCGNYVLPASPCVVYGVVTHVVVTALLRPDRVPHSHSTSRHATCASLMWSPTQSKAKYKKKHLKDGDFQLDLDANINAALFEDGTYHRDRC